MGRLLVRVVSSLGAVGMAAAGFVAGPAQAAIGANDYPDKDAVCVATGSVSGWCANSAWRKNGSQNSARGYAYRNCTDFAAWRANQLAARKVVPSGWGNANAWDESARRAGILVDGSPRVGDIAQSDSGSFGHVGIVAEIGTGANAGKFRVEEYNWATKNASGVTVYDGLYHATRWLTTTSYEYIHTSSNPQLTYNNVAAVLTDGRLVAKQGGLGTSWLNMTSGISQVRISGNNVAALTTGGTLLGKQGGFATGWMTLTSGVKSFDLS